MGRWSIVLARHELDSVNCNAAVEKSHENERKILPKGIVPEPPGVGVPFTAEEAKNIEIVVCILVIV